jgi:hypothetical protein
MTKKLRRLFPRLLGGEYRLTSPRSKKYNCIAWAVGHANRWWQEPPDGYWPDGIPEDGSLKSAVRLFESLGFSCTDDPGYEQGAMKIAVYGKAAEGTILLWTHAARQLETGRWTSKIGALQDIVHDTPAALLGGEYGTHLQIMRKSLASDPAAQPAASAAS